jgi:hypothetical protein
MQRRVGEGHIVTLVIPGEAGIQGGLLFTCPGPPLSRG